MQYSSNWIILPSMLNLYYARIVKFFVALFCDLIVNLLPKCLISVKRILIKFQTIILLIEYFLHGANVIHIHLLNILVILSLIFQFRVNSLKQTFWHYLITSFIVNYQVIKSLRINFKIKLAKLEIIWVWREWAENRLVLDNSFEHLILEWQLTTMGLLYTVSVYHVINNFPLI